MLVGQMSAGVAMNCGRYTRAGVPDCVSAQCQGHRQREHRTEHKGHTPNPRIEIKILDPSGIELGPPGWKTGTLLTIPWRWLCFKYVVLCVFQCQPTALLRASGSAQGGYMALSVVYF